MEDLHSNLFVIEPSKVKRKNSINASKIETPLGTMVAVADNDYLYALGFTNRDKMMKKINQLQVELDADIVMISNPILENLRNELNSYFNGDLKTFTVPLKYFGTDFQKESWKQLIEIKYGETMSYGELAVKLGKSIRHSRAVGSAAGANPIVILVPCHRLLAQNNNIGGFSCGVDKKKWLLQHETKYK